MPDGGYMLNRSCWLLIRRSTSVSLQNTVPGTCGSGESTRVPPPYTRANISPYSLNRRFETPLGSRKNGIRLPFGPMTGMGCGPGTRSSALLDVVDTIGPEPHVARCGRLLCQPL